MSAFMKFKASHNCFPQTHKPSLERRMRILLKDKVMVSVRSITFIEPSLKSASVYIQAVES